MKKRNPLIAGLAIILVIALALGGTLAYLYDSSDVVVNIFDSNSNSVKLVETTGSEYSIIPGTTQAKDPTVYAYTTAESYVFLQVTDATDGLVEYEINSEIWTLLEGYEGVYYTVVTEDSVLNVLVEDQVSYPATLTNEDMLTTNKAGEQVLKDGLTLTFQAYIIQTANFETAELAWIQFLGEEETENGYLTFASDSSFSLTVSLDGEEYASWGDEYAEYAVMPNLEYSTDGTNWSTVEKEVAVDAVLNGNSYYLYLRGYDNTWLHIANIALTGEDDNLRVSCTGNIMTLLDYENVDDVEMEYGAFMYLFCNCEALTTAPSLPATKLAEECYENMFEYCTSLEVAPALPATDLELCCYDHMFQGCTSLTVAPELPATTLANQCYSGMFANCTALVEAPELPATIMKDNCYSYMFEGCTSLKVAPELPATVLDISCYRSMFAGCTMLEKAPALPATTLAQWCYYGMFANCKSLTTLPELPATEAAERCYYNMFYNCTGIKISETQTETYTQAWKMNITEEANLWNYCMFKYTGGAFTGNPAADTTYYLCVE